MRAHTYEYSSNEFCLNGHIKYPFSDMYTKNVSTRTSFFFLLTRGGLRIYLCETAFNIQSDPLEFQIYKITAPAAKKNYFIQPNQTI